MNKLATIVVIFVTLMAVFTVKAHAYTTTVRLEQPQSPTNKNDFNLVYVTLDTNLSQTVSGQCYKKGPSDAGYTAFGSAFNFTNGGNTGTCAVNASLMNQNGTYSFKVIANGSIATTSNVVTVDYNTSSNPGTPINYGKQKIDNCTYKITFRTADDSGKTSKVVLYRSPDTSFNLDSGSQANQTNIGSNTDGSFTSFISGDCNKEYYFALRAFDVYGNGSGTTGDKNIKTTVTEGTTTETTEAGAIPVSETVVPNETTPGQGTGVVEGENQVDENASEDVLGEKTNANSVSEKIKNAVSSIFSFGILAAIADLFSRIIDFIKSLFN